MSEKLVPADNIAAPTIMRHQLTSGRYGLNTTDRGQRMDNGEIYFGIWKNIVDRQGRQLSGEFDLFTTDHDTRYLSETRRGELATFNQDIQRVADLRDIHGHDGIMLANDAVIYEAIRTGNYAAIAKWHVGVKELVHGRNIDDKDVQPDNLYAHKDKGALRGTFTDKVGSVNVHWYWTASARRVLPSYVYVVAFTNGCVGWGLKDNAALSSRPVRAELRPEA